MSFVLDGKVMQHEGEATAPLHMILGDLFKSSSATQGKLNVFRSTRSVKYAYYF
jgi:hypothetical protein